jgi:hypothetical protein
MNTHMDRAIFRTGASVPATSLYILICSLLDEGRLPTMDRVRELWTGPEDALSQSVDELISRGVLDPPPPWAKDINERLYLSRTWQKIVTAGNSSNQNESLIAAWLT